MKKITAYLFLFSLGYLIFTGQQTIDSQRLPKLIPLPNSGNFIHLAISPVSDTIKPVITHTPLPNQPKVIWPVRITATVIDNSGLDSVWVKWYKNSPSMGINHFKLTNAGGSLYTALFNSLNSYVTVSDSIIYRIYASDNSPMHNSDSTALYKFKIINQNAIVIGNGTIESNFPFTTNWMDGHTQYIYYASELTAMGTNALITKIGFDITQADPKPIRNFKISFQHTSLTNLTGFVTTGWTTAYAPASYTVPGLGWQMITLTAPFTYTGGNLLMEVCYDDTASAQYSKVNSTVTTGDFWGRYGDLPTADGCVTTSWFSTNNPPGKANTKFDFTPNSRVSNNNGGVPDKYSLSQNYPNPFNPVTKINFAIPQQGLVTLKIYDVLGREIKTLLNEVKKAGNFSIDFNAAEYATGIYFYKLESGTFSEVKRMIFLK